MKKHPIAVKLSLLLFLCLVVAIAYRVRGLHDARVHRAACYSDDLEKRNSLELSTAAINNEVQEIQRDQDLIDQLGDTDDETVIQRRNHTIDGVKLNLTKANRDRTGGQRGNDQIQPELPSGLAQ